MTVKYFIIIFTFLQCQESLYTFDFVFKLLNCLLNNSGSEHKARANEAPSEELM